MGAFCCCSCGDDCEEYAYPSNSIYRHCICLRFFFCSLEAWLLAFITLSFLCLTVAAINNPSMKMSALSQKKKRKGDSESQSLSSKCLLLVFFT